MKNIVTSIFTLLFFTMPLVVSADALSDQMDQMRFGLFREAAAQAGFDSMKPACVVKVSASAVKVHEPFMLAWGAWGTLDSELNKNNWAPTGAAMIAVDTPGKYKYQFTFYGAGDARISCETLVIVK